MNSKETPTSEAFLEPHSEPGVTEEEFRALEETFGVVLPEDMKAFYRQQNGGFFRKGQDYYVSDSEYELSLTYFHSIARAFHPNILPMDTLLNWQQMDEFLPGTLVPFCSDGGGDSYYIQADGQDNRVYYIFHEDIDEYLDTPENCLIAESFTDFLEKIHTR